MTPVHVDAFHESEREAAALAAADNQNKPEPLVAGFDLKRFCDDLKIFLIAHEVPRALFTYSREGWNDWDACPIDDNGASYPASDRFYEATLDDIRIRRYFTAMEKSIVEKAGGDGSYADITILIDTVTNTATVNCWIYTSSQTTQTLTL